MEAPSWLDDLDLSVEGPPWLAMGLRRVEERDWLWPDDQRDAELAERHRLLAERRDEVVHLADGTEAAGAEVLGLVRSALATRGLAVGGLPGGDPEEHPLVTAGRMVQEDLCLMVARPTAEGGVRHHLDAAILCFPSHWRLADKAGRPVEGVHGPVPRYDADLEVRVDRYLDRLRPGIIGMRRNWSVHESAALFAPVRPSTPAAIEVEDVATGLWLRSERQTLRALPESGAVLFTIRVQQVPFGALAGRPDVARALAARIEAQPIVVTAMNGLAPHVDAVLTWLRSTPV